MSVGRGLIPETYCGGAFRLFQSKRESGWRSECRGAAYLMQR